MRGTDKTLSDNISEKTHLFDMYLETKSNPSLPFIHSEKQTLQV